MKIKNIFLYIFSSRFRNHYYIKKISSNIKRNKSARNKVNHLGNYISKDAIIGNNIFMPHPIGIVIGNGVKIGDGCSIYQNVTIGQKNEKYPKIGNNVIIFPNSAIIGDIIIGDNVVIGAGSVVIYNVPDNAIIAGNPSKIIRYRND